MKKFWGALGKGLAKLAVWCMEHPDELIAITEAAKKVKKS